MRCDRERMLHRVARLRHVVGSGMLLVGVGAALAVAVFAAVGLVSSGLEVERPPLLTHVSKSPGVASSAVDRGSNPPRSTPRLEGKALPWGHLGGSGGRSKSRSAKRADGRAQLPVAATVSSASPSSGRGTAAASKRLSSRSPQPNALKVAREFAKGFVVYETGGKASAFRGALEAAATPELSKALLQRPPKQPAGVKVPKAEVLNVVAGPSQGSVYKVSVSLLRVGVTSELRLAMEKVKSAGKSAGKDGKRAEWRVTNVLG